MSFILDALKKSEAERQRGEVPKLQNEAFSPLPLRRPLWPLFLTLALLFNGAVFGWWLLFREEQHETIAVASVNFEQIDAGGEAASAEPVGFPASTPAQRAIAPGESDAADVPVPGAVGSSQGDADPASSAEPDVETVVIEEAPVKSAVAVARPSSAKTAEQGAPARRTQPATAAPARSKAVAAPVAESYPLVSELSGNARSGLPGLDLQLHFFTPVAERRLIRLNGANLREGDRSGDGLSVVEITSNGVKLSWGGARFFLPTGRP